MSTVYKTGTLESSSDELFDVVMSDETVDRVGDIVSADGWKLANFRKNPVALYGHDSSHLPIGRWENVRVEGKKLIGKLRLAEPGTSGLVDAIRSLIKQKMLNAVSVGFRTQKAEPIDPNEPWGGYRYLQQELVECSVCAVPANPNAMIQRALSNIPDDVLNRLLAMSGISQRSPSVIGSPGTSAKTSPATKDKTMSKLSELIEQDRAEIITLRDAQTPLAKKVAEGDELSAEESAEFDRLTGEIATVERRLVQRENSERILSGQARSVAPGSSQTAIIASPAVVQPQFMQRNAARKEKPFDLLIKMQVVHLKAHIDRKTPEEIAKAIYPDRQDVEAVIKSVTNPAATTVAGWAAELVDTAIWDFLESLTPLSAYGQLSGRGIRFSFGRNGSIKIPRRNHIANAAGDLRGAFVGEGQPIPVRKGNFGAVSLIPHKMGVISTFTKEMAAYSTPQIEGLIREGIVEDTAIAIDQALLDAVAGDAIRPAGLKNGVTPIPGTAGGDVAAIEADLLAALSPFIAANAASGLVWMLNPGKLIKLQFATTALGIYPFRDQLAQGTLAGYPYITSTNVPLTELWLVRAADFVSSTADTPEFDVSDVATIHEDDGGYPADQAMRPGTATVLPIVDNAGTPVTAHPVRSLWQTASFGIRMLLGMDWAMRRAGMIQIVNALTW